MNKINAEIIIIFLLFFHIFNSGCLDIFNFDDTIIYESHPVEIQYNLSYGYIVECLGIGNYEITYNCDIPINTRCSTAIFKPIYDKDYQEINQFNNSFYRWIIKSSGDNNYKLGISMEVHSFSNLIEDISGKNALDIDEIKIYYPSIYEKYTGIQKVNGSVYIDPYDSSVQLIAQNVFSDTNSNNSLLLAKDLFLWLKKNTEYKIHPIGDGEVQTCSETIKLKTGDCDDLSFLYIALCRALDIPARFIRGYLIEENNGVISSVAHAWVEIFVGVGIGDSGWMPVECACASNDMDVQLYQNFGVESVGHLRLFVDDGSDESLNQSLSGPRVNYSIGISVDMVDFVEVEDYKIIQSKELKINSEGIRKYI